MRIDDIRALKTSTGRLLGVDFGDVRTGLAVSDASRYLASGLETVAPGSMSKTADAVAAAAREHRVSGIVLGLPVNMDGSQGFRAERIRTFADILAERVSVPIVLLDERLTTVSASRFLNETNTRGKKRKAVIDTLSAQIILQNALDRLGHMAER